MTARRGNAGPADRCAARRPLEISRGREISTFPPRISMRRLDTNRPSEAR
jgi:hypothetical protein